MLALVAIVIVGCSEGADACDTAGCEESGGSGELLLRGYGQNPCTGSTCTWYVAGDGEIGTVELWLIETGAPTYQAGCVEARSDSSGLVCGAWSEYHNDFRTIDVDPSGRETKAISLDVVTDPRDQATNDSTLFDSEINTSLTWLIMGTEPSGSDADCVTAGDDDAYFSESCANSWE